jgi:hypothetical protein
MTTATLPRKYGQPGGQFRIIDGNLVASRRRTGTEVHLTSVTIEDGVITGMANTTLCNHRSGSNVFPLASSTPTCQRCLSTWRGLQVQA